VYLLKRLRALESSCCALTRRDARRAPASCMDPPLPRMSDGSPGREGIVCRLTCCHDYRNFRKNPCWSRAFTKRWRCDTKREPWHATGTLHCLGCQTSPPLWEGIVCRVTYCIKDTGIGGNPLIQWWQSAGVPSWEFRCICHALATCFIVMDSDACLCIASGRAPTAEEGPWAWRTLGTSDWAG